MKKWLLILAGLLVFLADHSIYAQQEAMIIKVNQNYAVINMGTYHGVKAGDRFRLQTPNNPNDYGEVQVIKATKTIAAVKLIEGTPGYTLKIGDREPSEESSVVDELLQDTQVQHYEDRTYQDPGPRINRKGFIIGGGIGLGGLSMTASAGGGSVTESRLVFQTDFKIGYAPTNTLEIYYVNKVAWWGESDVTLIQGLSSIGFSNYLNAQTATGIFLTGGIGVSVLAAPFEDVSSSSGFGLFGGVGYEFTKHWSVQGDLLYSNIEDSGVTLNSLGIRIVLSGLSY